ncbi:helicase-associated domain-containing protein [Actinomycetospora sp. CA-084318]|uniref:helicase-associated domain-containing protein n=1 Tax=Actinomycetospora sp. CA-084318 TaxID=3239892 RepID=UPI003D99E49D
MALTFAEYLETLDDEALAALLIRRRDVCAEPVPRDLAHLADRLCTADSLFDALAELDQDAVEVGRAAAALGPQSAPETIAALLDADDAVVEAVVDRLVALGLAYPDGAYLRLPERVDRHFHADLGGGAPITVLVRSMVVEDLRVLADAHGVSTAGLRKPELVEAVVEALHDVLGVAGRVRALDRPLLHRLAGILGPGDGYAYRLEAAEEGLVDRGMLVLHNRALEVPHEVAIAVWLLVAKVTGPPTLPTAVAGDTTGAAQEFLRHVGAVLDHLRASPVPQIKAGGVGKRERTRLVKALDLPDDAQLALALDLAFALGLVAPGAGGLTTTDRYPEWRAEPAARRWSSLATAWIDLPHCPTHRVDPDSTESAPPLPPIVDSSSIRRALLRVGRDGRSLRAACDEIAWYAPMRGPEDWRAAIAHAVVDETRRLGMGDGDALGPLDPSSGRVEELLGDVACQMVLQSDLTAVVSGVPDDEGQRLLTDAADVEARGAATVHRFSTRSVRRALDAGWTADTLLAGLRHLAGDIPQPLDYLVHDAARVHGSIRVHEVRTCVVADESLALELAAARSLRKLGWRRITSTVLGSSEPPAVVLRLLRDAGYSPVLDDGSGAVAVERAQVETAEPLEDITTTSVPAAEFLRRLRSSDARVNPTAQRLAHASGGRLSSDELDQLAYALDHTSPVRITYRVSSGSVGNRVITPQVFQHRWLRSWCHQAGDVRDFTVTSILGVGPA